MLSFPLPFSPSYVFLARSLSLCLSPSVRLCPPLSVSVRLCPNLSLSLSIYIYIFSLSLPLPPSFFVSLSLSLSLFLSLTLSLPLFVCVCVCVSLSLPLSLSLSLFCPRLSLSLSLSLSPHIHIYIYIHTYVYIYIHIYIEREREWQQKARYTRVYLSMCVWLPLHPGPAVLDSRKEFLDPMTNTNTGSGGHCYYSRSLRGALGSIRTRRNFQDHGPLQSLLLLKTGAVGVNTCQPLGLLRSTIATSGRSRPGQQTCREVSTLEGMGTPQNIHMFSYKEAKRP